MITRCPGCSKPVEEADEACPHCERDFSAPVKRKFELEPEAPAERPQEAPQEEAARPKPVLEAAHANGKKSSPRLEERRPEAPPPVPYSPPAYESPPSYVPGGYEPSSDPYKYTAPKSGPSWHWMALAAVCAIGLVSYMQKQAPAPEPPVQKAAEPVKPQPPAGEVLVKPVDAAKAAAAAATAAAQLSATADIEQKPPAPPPKERPKRKTLAKAPVAVEPEPEAPPSQSPFDDGPASRPKGNSSEWRMRGVISDLITAEPVGRAEVVFTDPRNGRQFRTGTDTKGNYRATLPVTADGYDLTIRHSKYEPKYFEDGVPPYRELGVEQRHKVADDFMKVMQNKDLVRAEGGEVLQRNFVLIPTER